MNDAACLQNVMRSIERELIIIAIPMWDYLLKLMYNTLTV